MVQNSKIAVILPVFNEDKRISQVLKDLTKTKLLIIIVDDGSTDKTKLRIKKFSKSSNKLTVLGHKVNLGKGAALKTGCDYAFSNGIDAVILMDSDGQHSINDLSLFTKTLSLNKYDVLFGSRNLNMGVPLVRYIGNKIASVMVGTVFGIYVSDLICGYRALTKNAYKKVKWESVGYGVETEMVIRVKSANLKYCEIPVATIYYDNYKGVSILDSFGVFTNLFYWKIKGI